jgi:anti-anti-sigma factor
MFALRRLFGDLRRADQRGVVVSSPLVDSGWRVIDAPSSFAIRYSQNDLDETLRMALIGELDLTAVGMLDEHLRDLKPSGLRVRLDLSGLRFMDCSGLNTIVAALTEAERAGRPLEVDPQLTSGVQRMIRLADVAEVFWPVSRCGRGFSSEPSPAPVSAGYAASVLAAAAAVA